MENKENLELEMDISQESEITEPVVLSKGVKSKRKGITADTVFVICNTIFMILFVVITLYPVLNTVALSFNDGTDAVRGGIHLIPRKFSTYAEYYHRCDCYRGKNRDRNTAGACGKCVAGIYHQQKGIPV